MSIQIITDSTCDLSATLIQELGLEIVPLKVCFGEKEYTEGVDITTEQFYTKQAASAALPTTSQPSPQAFENVFRPILERGDEAVVITLSSAISGTFQSASIAKRTLKSEHIHLIDSRSATIGLGDLVLKANAMSHGGESAKEIVKTIENYASRLRILALIDTLKYLHKGGRLSTVSSILGGMLSIKPLVGLVDGKVELIGRARGTKGACDWVGKRYAADKVDLSLGTVFGYTGTSDRMNEMIAVCQRYGVQDYYIESIGSVIGTHAGPGCAGIGYYVADSKKKA